jgi:hypothetical protein
MMKTWQTSTMCKGDYLVPPLHLGAIFLPYPSHDISYDISIFLSKPYHFHPSSLPTLILTMIGGTNKNHALGKLLTCLSFGHTLSMKYHVISITTFFQIHTLEKENCLL